jgi:hypothetical protein
MIQRCEFLTPDAILFDQQTRTFDRQLKNRGLNPGAEMRPLLFHFSFNIFNKKRTPQVSGVPL